MRLRGLIPLAAFVLLLGALAWGLTRDPRILPSELIEADFPEFSLSNLEDTETITEAQLQGRVSLINIFGSWCIACTVEHPQLMALKDKQGLQLIGVDWRDTREDADRWLTRHGNPYDVVVFDPNSQLIVELGVTGAPETFIVDATGQIRYKHVGIITPEIWDNTLAPIVESVR